jgi:Dna[CI] antecedent, DciA
MRKVQDYLGAGDALRRLNQEVRRLVELDRAYKRAVPEALAEVSGVNHLEGGTLFLWADGGAVAAKLRQVTPTVLVKLRNLLPECTGIRVIVRVGGSQTSRPRGTRPRVGETGVEALRGLASGLPPSSLRTALSRLAARGTKRSQDGK